MFRFLSMCTFKALCVKLRCASFMNSLRYEEGFFVFARSHKKKNSQACVTDQNSRITFRPQSLFELSLYQSKACQHTKQLQQDGGETSTREASTVPRRRPATRCRSQQLHQRSGSTGRPLLLFSPFCFVLRSRLAKTRMATGRRCGVITKIASHDTSGRNQCYAGFSHEG